MRTLALLGVLFAAGVAGAAAETVVKPVNADGKGVAVHGYDVVAYFTENKAVKGSASHQFEWNGAVWRFSSAANRDRFAADPVAYGPQFGGYCAYAVSRNYTADIDPDAFSIVNGKLYLNYSRVVQIRWQLDRDGNIAKGDANWPKLVGKPAKGTK